MAVGDMVESRRSHRHQTAGLRWVWRNGVLSFRVGNKEKRFFKSDTNGKQFASLFSVPMPSQLHLSFRPSIGACLLPYNVTVAFLAHGKLLHVGNCDRIAQKEMAGYTKFPLLSYTPQESEGPRPSRSLPICPAEVSEVISPRRYPPPWAG